MRRIMFVVLVFAGFVSCSENAPEKRQPNVTDNLPIADRDLLLAPLEGALDDLRENIQNNGSGFLSKQDATRGDLKASLVFRLSGKDTLMLVATLERGGNHEKHSWFFDEQKRLFISEHELLTANAGLKGEISHEAFRFYYEENGSKLSSYGKYSQAKQLPDVWTPVCLSIGKEEMLRGRMRTIRQLAVAD